MSFACQQQLPLLNKKKRYPLYPSAKQKDYRSQIAHVE
jgi:hypothetical protein